MPLGAYAANRAETVIVVRACTAALVISSLSSSAASYEMSPQPQSAHHSDSQRRARDGACALG